MQIHDIGDYYRPRHFPWLPVSLIGIAVVIAGIHFFSNDRGAKPAEPSEVAEVETSSPVDASSGAGANQPPETRTVEPAIAPHPAPEPADPLPKAEIEAALAECRALESDGRLEAAREKYLSILHRTGGNIRPQIENAIGQLSIELFTTPRPMTGKIEYIVKPGDSLSEIAAAHICPVLLIQKANQIADAAKIRIGQRLVFPDRPKFAVLISTSQNTLSILLDGRLFKKYPVGTGRHAKTPVGTFRISDKIKHPPWWPGGGKPVIPYGDKANILGTHWLALEATGDTPRLSGYGIHGTWDERSIGRQSSDGCVRMRNGDVGELYMLLPRKTPVRIVE